MDWTGRAALDFLFLYLHQSPFRLWKRSPIAKERQVFSSVALFTNSIFLFFRMFKTFQVLSILSIQDFSSQASPVRNNTIDLRGGYWHRSSPSILGNHESFRAEKC
ncbi:hypothetical protein ABW19_dt0207295 [Dactylella cylindrospora]|nr:hypothetical protein ABW19_dt0207295 [Dactylella cylindrospora]